MHCLFALFALFTPRVVAVLLWFFSDWFNEVFDSTLWPVLGLVFLPTTLLWYTAVHHWFDGVWSFWPVVGIVISLAIDVSPAGGKRRKN